MVEFVRLGVLISHTYNMEIRELANASILALRGLGGTTQLIFVLVPVLLDLLPTILQVSALHNALKQRTSTLICYSMSVLIRVQVEDLVVK